MINIGIWPMVILALLIIANSIFMVYKTVDVKKRKSKPPVYTGGLFYGYKPFLLASPKRALIGQPTA
ncbi:hypothetical protein AADX89_12015, partial [Staphylococcus epidermidis]